MQNMQEKAKELAELLKNLANEQRLLILCALSESPLKVGEIHKYTPHISQPALSQHLQQLKLHGILSSEKHGLNVTYSIADGRIKELLNTLKEHYC